MASKFTDFIKEQKIDTRRLLAASRALECRTGKERKASRKRPMKEGEAKPERVKGRSGRPVTGRLLGSIAAGKPVSGPSKTRLLRALNRILEQKKQPAAQLKQLF